MKIRSFIMRFQGESGQTVVLGALALSIFMLGAIGLAIDGAHIYAQFQMAQAAADAAAQAGIMSIFDGTNTATGNAAAFTTTSSFTCAASDPRTPCRIAAMNGYNLAGDVITVNFPPDSVAPGVNFSGSDPTNLIQVTIQRNVNTTLMALLGPSFSVVRATAMAGIVDVLAPVPILVTHPTLTGSFSTNGGVLVTICGGPKRSIQVNSGPYPTTANITKGSGTIDLSHAGPPDPGNCTTGTGADFGTWGGPSTPPFIFNGGSTGRYLQPASPIQDPLAGVAPPPLPSTPAPNPTPLGNGVNGCPAAPVKGCMLYYPGLYPNGIDGKLSTVVLSPGIYYVQNGGVTCAALCSMYMATGVPADPTTGWPQNVLIYNTGNGAINIGANGNISLTGSPASSPYLGILFFEDRNAPANTGANAHSMGGGGGLQLLGTVYLTNTLAIMNADPTHYQELDLQGTPGSSTYIQGEIIVGSLHMGGNAAILMDLNSNATLDVREVAMVN